jgi:hypothetical protein
MAQAAAFRVMDSMISFVGPRPAVRYRYIARVLCYMTLDVAGIPDLTLNLFAIAGTPGAGRPDMQQLNYDS